MKTWYTLRVELQQFNICPMNITTILVSIFCLCERDSGYRVNFSGYERKSNTASEYGISNVCIQLIGSLLGMRYHLYTNNWYTTVSIVETLLYKGINLTGTVRGNRKYLHKFVKQELSKRDWIVCRKEKSVCVNRRIKTCNFVIH